jgi:hypothetical protein
MNVMSLTCMQGSRGRISRRKTLVTPRVNILRQSQGLTVCGPSLRPGFVPCQGKRIAHAGLKSRAGGAVLVSPALQRGESDPANMRPESRRDGAFFCRDERLFHPGVPSLPEDDMIDCGRL